LLTRKEYWLRSDGAECARLVQEMADDGRWQVQLFTFALTATAVILGVQARNPTEVPGLLLLSPLVVLIPSSLIILNRARTRNRKAAFMMCYLDTKRLRIAGVDEQQDSLNQVRRRCDLPWETGLHILERNKPHIAPALLYMGFSYLIVEVTCITLAAVFSSDRRVQAFVTIVAVAYVILTGYRIVWLLRLRRSASIQGYVHRWLALRFPDLHGCPNYLVEWIHETWGPQGPPPSARP
jgi:hypothetical protein